MPKKIILIIICLALFTGCGKKMDPEYKAKIDSFFDRKI